MRINEHPRGECNTVVEQKATFQNTIMATLHDFFMQQGVHKTYWIAYSGGLDSQVLLSACAKLREVIPLTLHAIHVNHHLQKNAANWALFCAETCAALQIKYHEFDIAIALLSGESLEEVARNKRYEIFAQCLSANDVLLTAHHQADQAETFLLQLLRGAGPKGLAAMPPCKTFARGLHARPLLKVAKSELELYAKQNKLTWQNDLSNDDIIFTRNFIRHCLMPVLQKKFPAADHLIARSALHCAETQMVLEDYLAKDLVKLQGMRPGTLSISKLKLFSAEKQRLLLRAFIIAQGFPLPDAKKIKALQQTLLHARRDRLPKIEWGNCVLRRYRDDLYLQIMAPEVVSPSINVTWDGRSLLNIDALGQLQAQAVMKGGMRLAASPFIVTFKEPRDVVFVLGRGRLKMKNLLQEWGVPPWARKTLPLIFLDNKLLAAVGYFVAPDYQAEDGEGYEMTWTLFQYDGRVSS